MKKILDRIVKDRTIRREITKQSHYWFFHVFLSAYIKYPIALFHREMFALTERVDLPVIAVMAFRGSGKSTIMNLSHALWAVLGRRKKKFVVIISNTVNQAQGHFSNILWELKNNRLLASDLGPFDVDHNNRSLVLTAFEAKIMAVSREQSIRGLLFGSWRPDLIIIDDIEDSSSVKLEKDRDDTYDWFMNEVWPSGGSSTNIVVLGNLLHKDSFMMRIRGDILEKRTKGIFRAYPILDDNDQILWPGKFPTMMEVEALEQSLPSEVAWDTEYRLEYGGFFTDFTQGDKDDQKPAQKLAHYRISTPRKAWRSFAKLITALDNYEHDSKN